jgi:hypothetical protein
VRWWEGKISNLNKIAEMQGKSAIKDRYMEIYSHRSEVNVHNQKLYVDDGLRAVTSDSGRLNER